MIDTFLIPENTNITAKGDGVAVDLSGAGSRVFLAILKITNALEQEALEISVYGSADGAEWSPKPVASLPQKFYAGEYPLLVDLAEKPEIKYVRAHWEVNRWGRGPETPSFTLGVTLKEVPAEILREGSKRT